MAVVGMLLIRFKKCHGWTYILGDVRNMSLVDMCYERVSVATHMAFSCELLFHRELADQNGSLNPPLSRDHP